MPFSIKAGVTIQFYRGYAATWRVHKTRFDVIETARLIQILNKNIGQLSKGITMGNGSTYEDDSTGKPIPNRRQRLYIWGMKCVGIETNTQGEAIKLQFLKTYNYFIF